jgi:hypothetical protein
VSCQWGTIQPSKRGDADLTPVGGWRAVLGAVVRYLGGVGSKVGFVCRDRLAAVLADDERTKLGPARAVTDVQRRVASVEQVSLGPCLERQDGREQIESGVGKPILIPVRVGAVSDSFEKAVLD